MMFVTVSDSSRRYGDQMVNEAVDTPRSLFEKLGVNYQRGQSSLNGTILTADKMDTPFAALGVTGRATLNSIVKGDGAVVFITVSDSSRRYGEQVVNEAVDTPRALFERLGVNYQRGQSSLNGTILNDSQLDSSFAMLGVTSRATLNSIVKGDGANQ